MLPIRPLLARYSAHRILTYEMLIGTAILAPFAVPGLLGQDYSAVSLAGWGSLGYAVVFSGILTNLLYFTAVGRVGPSRAAVYGYLQSFLASSSRSSCSASTSPSSRSSRLVVVGSIIFGRSTISRRPGSPGRLGGGSRLSGPRPIRSPAPAPGRQNPPRLPRRTTRNSPVVQDGGPGPRSSVSNILRSRHTNPEMGRGRRCSGVFAADGVLANAPEARADHPRERLATRRSD